MPTRVDLYNSAYANYGSEAYRQVRIETYGEDFGQTSWVTTEESRDIPQLLDLQSDSRVLELGCGSGGYALQLVNDVGCQLVGLDLNAPGVHNANPLAAARGLATRARFEQCDVSKRLPLDANTFDALFSNDVLCHLPGRPEVLSEMFRALEARRKNAVQRCAGGRRNDFPRRNGDAELRWLLRVQSARRE